MSKKESTPIPAGAVKPPPPPPPPMRRCKDFFGVLILQNGKEIEAYAKEDKTMNPLPFKMRTETAMERYRAETFWDKEPETIAWVRSFSPHDVFFDIGANVGIYSLFAASLYPEMRIFSFEPMGANHQALVDNKKMNGFDLIYPMRCAVGRQYGMMAFIADDAEAGASGGQITDRQDGPHVHVLSVDGLCYGRHAEMTTRFERLPIPDHIKIDIDGQELEVVKGMQQTLPYIKSALIEVSKASKGPIMDIMTGAGFTTDNRFNTMSPHSRERREREGIDAENIVFTR